MDKASLVKDTNWVSSDFRCNFKLKPASSNCLLTLGMSQMQMSPVLTTGKKASVKFLQQQPNQIFSSSQLWKKPRETAFNENLPLAKKNVSSEG